MTRHDTSQMAHAPVTAQYQDDFVDRWDRLIDWERRKAGEKSFFLDILRNNGAHRVLDAAAGTGYHAVRLAQNGFDVTAVDICPNMIARTQENAANYGVRFEAQVKNWLEMQDSFAPFDAIVCLGSSFPHLTDPEDRARALAIFRGLLRPGGTLILDHRNFDAIRAGKYDNPAKLYYGGSGISVTPELIGGHCTFTYDFPDGVRHRLEVAAIGREDMRAELAGAGFEQIQTCGDFQEIYSLNSVGFLIHIARSPKQGKTDV